MNEKVPSPQIWGEISIEDIKRHLAVDDIAHALKLVQLRLDGLRGTIKDIEAALSEATEINPQLWQEERDAYQREIEVLEGIRQRYSQ